MTKIRVRVNRADYVADVESRLLLVDLIRDKLGLTGTHIGCVVGKCGCCTIILNGNAVKSCLMFATQVDGGEIMTIEGLAEDGKLHPLQEAFQEYHGLQCGYCTPGMVMSAYELIQRKGSLTEEAIRSGMTGNLCRCTGYQGIVRAIKAASEKMVSTGGTR